MSQAEIGIIVAPNAVFMRVDEKFCEMNPAEALAVSAALVRGARKALALSAKLEPFTEEDKLCD